MSNADSENETSLPCIYLKKYANNISFMLQTAVRKYVIFPSLMIHLIGTRY
jgi:hypothetical protein